MSNLRPTFQRLKHDSALAWRPGRLWLPAMKFNGMSVSAINEGGAANDAYGLNWEGSHTGAPVSQEISTFGVNGILMDTAADEVNTYVLVPDDMDLSKRIYARVHWTCGSTDTADTVTWKVWYKPIIFNTTAVAAIGNTGGTALDSVVPLHTLPVATAYTWNVTLNGYLDAGKLPETTEALLLSVELDAFAAGLSEDKFLLGLQLRYTPKRLVGPDGMLHEAKPATFVMGKTYAT